MHAGLWLLDRRAGVLRCVAVWSGDGADAGGWQRLSRGVALGWGVDLPGRVWASGRAAHVPAVERDPNMPRARAARAAGAVGAYAVPIRHDGRPAAVLELLLADDSPPLYDVEGAAAVAWREMLGDLADPDVVAHQHALGAHELELQRKAAQQAAVAEFGRRALAVTDAGELMDEATRLVGATLGIDHTALLTLDADEDGLVIRAGTGWRDGVIGTVVSARRGSLAGYALVRGEPVVIDDLRTESRFRPSPLLPEHGIVSSLGVPIISAAGPVGVLAAHSPLPSRFGAEDVDFMRTVANVVAAALMRGRAEDELRRTNALLDAIVTGATDSIYIKDATGRVLFANDAGAEALGRTPAELIGRRPSEVSPALRDLEPEDVEAMRSGQWRSSESEVELDGRRRWYSTTRGPYRAADGRIAGVIGIARDITERRLSERRERVLAEAGRLLATATDTERALAETAQLPVPEICDLCEVTLVAADGAIGTIAIAGADESLTRAARELRERYPTDPSAEAGIAAVVRTGEAVLMQGVTPEAMAAMARDEVHLELLARVPVRSVIIAPLTARGRTFGTIALATVGDRPQLGLADLDLAAELAGRAALATENARLFSERQRTIETLQQGLLPPELPAVPGLELGAAFHAGREGLDVGGDFYDVLPAGDAWLVVVGDVCGRGAEAATITAVARHTLRGAAMYDDDPASLLRSLNSALLQQTLDLRFCTVLCARLEPAGGGFRVRLANGGHPGPLLSRRDGTARVIDAPGTLIGVLRDPHVGEASFELAGGDSLILFTDGLLDVRRARGVVRALDLQPTVARAADDGAGAIASALAQEALAGAGPGGLGDDVAVVALRVVPDPGSGG